MGIFAVKKTLLHAISHFQLLRIFVRCSEKTESRIFWCSMSLRGYPFELMAAAPVNIESKPAYPSPLIPFPPNALQYSPFPAPPSNQEIARRPIIEPTISSMTALNTASPRQAALKSPVRRHVLAPPPAPPRKAPALIIPIVNLMPSAPVAPPEQSAPQQAVKTRSRRSGEEMFVPEPTFFRNTKKGEYGLRCVCGESFTNVGMVQCDKCDFWLHTMCVNIARTGRHEQYFCPFCEGKKIRCSCGKNMKYDEPLIKCTKCGNWVHKDCENLDFGADPPNFVCKRCGGPSEYELKRVCFDRMDQSVPDGSVAINCDRGQILGGLPDGPLKVMVMEDLDKGHLQFRETVERYFMSFCPLLFDRIHEFWRVFCDTLCAMLGCDREVILNAVDILARKLLYSTGWVYRGVDRVDGLENSEAIEDYLGKLSIPRMESLPTPVRLTQTSDGRVITPVAIDDGAFICEVGGFLIHTDEVKTDNGIPLNCMLITDNELVIDTEGGSFDLAPSIKRSFHFNTIVKLVRVDGELKVGLFAVRRKGPLSEEKSKRGPAIPASGEIVLPFDGDIPYPTKKCEWKDRKHRVRSTPIEKKPKPQAPDKTKRRQSETRVKTEYEHEGLTLLSSFYDDSVPPLPFVLLPDDDAVDQYRTQQEMRMRIRSRGRRNP